MPALWLWARSSHFLSKLEPFQRASWSSKTAACLDPQDRPRTEVLCIKMVFRERGRRQVGQYVCLSVPELSMQLFTYISHNVMVKVP